MFFFSFKLKLAFSPTIYLITFKNNIKSIFIKLSKNEQTKDNNSASLRGKDKFKDTLALESG